MGNLTSNLNQNITDFANQLIEQERSKNNSLNQSYENEYDEDNVMMNMKQRNNINGGGGGGTTNGPPYAGGTNSAGVGINAFYPNLTIAQKTVRVLVDDGIQFDIDILSDNLTCGWLISEVTRLYTEYLREKNKFLAQYSKQHQEKDFHQIIQMSRRQQLNFNKSLKGGSNSGVKKEKQKLIVALKTYDQNESIDHWLTMYDRNLTPIQDGEVLIAHFAKIASNKRKQIAVGDFEMIKVIGRGGFSRVLLCRKKDTGRLYAMKILKKSKIIREKKIKPILSERAVLEQLDHPFIVKLHWAFQSKEELFFILDICTGGEIFFHLNNFKRFPEQLAKFYFSEILLGLEYLHDRDIVYRDIKPENILIDIEGHIKIADFGLAKIIPNRQKSFSFCGSPEYMSPEMLKGRGHDKQLDYYCLGALLYEMLTGLPPYYSKDTNQMYIRILNEELSFPDFINRQHPVVDLLIRLLAKDPRNRIQTIDEIKQHVWLRDVNWKSILKKEVTPPFVPSIRQSNFDPEFNELPIDFDEMEMKMRLTTERRQSYYIESTVQSKNCTENSFYFNNPNQQAYPQAQFNIGNTIFNEQQLMMQEEGDSYGNGVNNSNNAGSQHQTAFNNFFANPGDDVKDIYNDSSGTNNTNNSIQNIKHKMLNNSNTLNNQSNQSKNDDSDAFRNFSFYDSPLEENEILTQIKRCCIKIGQLPQHLYSTNPLQSAQIVNISNNGNTTYQKQLNTNLHKLQSHMQQYGALSNQKRLICEEQDEEEDDSSAHQKSLQNLDDHDTSSIQQQQLHALPSESSNSIIIEHTDIAIPLSDSSQINIGGSIKGTFISHHNKKMDIQEVTRALKDSVYNQKGGYMGHQPHKSQDFMLSQQQQQQQYGMDDFNNAMGSFSSKSINTYDESNQSVAQEFKTNESIAMQTYNIANINKQGGDIPNQKLMNSDEIQKISSIPHQQMLAMGGHIYKKSMINPTQMRLPLEIQLPNEQQQQFQDLDFMVPMPNYNQALYSNSASKIKADVSASKTSAFLPQMVSPTKRQTEINSPSSQQANFMKSPNNLSTKDILGGIQMKGSFRGVGQSPCANGGKQQVCTEASPMTNNQQWMTTQTNTTQYTTTQNTGSTLYKFQTPDHQQQQQMDHPYMLNTKKSFLQESVQQLNKQYQDMMTGQQYQEIINGQQQMVPGLRVCEVQAQNDEGGSPDLVKKVAFAKRTTAKFRSMDLTSQSLGRINTHKLTSGNEDRQYNVHLTNQQQFKSPLGGNKDWKSPHDMLTDLKEVSLEGANSISLSPQRSCLPDFTPNPGNKIQTLKKSKIQQAKAAKNLKSKVNDPLQSPQIESSIPIGPNLGGVSTIPKGFTSHKPSQPTALQKKNRPNNLKLEAGQMLAQQQQQMILSQGKYSSNNQPGSATMASIHHQLPPQHPDEKQNHGKLSSKNSNQKPNLFSEKSSTNLQQIGSPMMQSAGTPTKQTQQITTLIPSTLKGKFDFVGYGHTRGEMIQPSYSSGGTTKVHTPASGTLKTTLQSPQNVKSTIAKKIHQQIEGGQSHGVSRNDNPKITTSAGAMLPPTQAVNSQAHCMLGYNSTGSGNGSATGASSTGVGTPGLRKNQSTTVAKKVPSSATKNK